MLYELVRRSSAVHDYTVFHPELDYGDEPPVVGSDGDLGTIAKEDRPIRMHRSPVALAARRGTLRRPVDTARVTAAERTAAQQIDEGDFDLAFVHSCQFTHTPSVLRHITTPSVYFVQEARRNTFEVVGPLSAAGPVPRPWVRPDRFARWGFEQVLRHRDRLAAEAATVLACSSVYVYEAICKGYGLDAKVCPPGVDSELFSPDDGGDRQPERRRVLSVGALDKVKGHDIIVRALASMPEADRPALDVVFEREDDAYAAELAALAASLGVDATLHRRIPDQELAALYRRARVSVCAARLEPFGLTVLESLSSGTPVVAVREGGYRETVVDGVNGYLVERSPSAFATALGRVFAGDLSDEPQSIRSTVVPRWSWDTSVERLHEIFEGAVEGHG
jgi:glycosyltransferase involved in cell wall biosynthesis